MREFFVLGLLVGLSTRTWSAETVVLNGHHLTDRETAVLRFIGTNVIPNLTGETLEGKVRAAVRVAWWSLKEGAISDWNFNRLKNTGWSNIHGYSLCHKSTGDELIDPLTECGRGMAWLVGTAAVQAFTEPKAAQAQEDRVLAIIRMSWSGRGRTVNQVLEEAASLAGLSDENRRKVTTLRPGPLRTSWLLRHPVVGFGMAYQFEVTPECFSEHSTDKQKRDCMKAGKGAGERFGGTDINNQNTIRDLISNFTAWSGR